MADSKPHKVYVIADNYGDDLSFRIACPIKGLSPVYLIPNKAESIGHNPYLVYGDKVQEFTGVNKYNCTITVAHVRSGRLDPDD